MGKEREILLQGKLEALDLATLIQLQNDKSVRIKVQNEDGEEGEIYLGEGQILHALLGPCVGEDALFRLLAWKKGAFLMEEGATDAISIGEDAGLVLLRGLQTVDEEVSLEQEEDVEDALFLVREVEQIPSVWRGGVVVEGKVEGDWLPFEEGFVDVLDELESGLSWGEVRPVGDGKVVLIRKRSLTFVFHVDYRYEARKLLKIIERRMGHAVAKG